MRRAYNGVKGVICVAMGQFGIWLKGLLADRGVSLRGLGKLTGIDPATLSRINSGKQQPTLSHLERIARTLGVPLTEALGAAGFDTAGARNGGETRRTPEADEAHHLGTAIRKTTTSLADRLDQLTNILVEYRLLAGTEQGRTLIIERTAEKLQQSGAHGQFLSQVRALYEIATDSTVSLYRQSLAGSALLYFILEADVIPDSEFPIGYVDDAIAVQTVWEWLSEDAQDKQEERAARTPPV